MASITPTSSSSPSSIVLPGCDDFHLHVRDGPILTKLLTPVVARFRRALIMPNLKPPVTTTELALAYRDRILKAIESDSKNLLASGVSETAIRNFTPLMSLYLTDTTSVDEIKKAKESKHVYAVKLYPAGATTNSQNGVTDVVKVYPTLRAMAELGMPLLVHSEVTDTSVDLFDRERVFIERILKPLVEAIPTLKVVCEHVTTSEAVEFVKSAGPNVGATITAHHLLYNRNAIFKGGVQPHYYCLPVLKRETHRLALLDAATSGNSKFFAGTDSAPHAQAAKECGCGAAGCYTAFAALEMYTEAFEQKDALSKLRAFMCENGARFYGIPINPPDEHAITLVRREWTVPLTYELLTDTITLAATPAELVVPLRAGETMPWTLQLTPLSATPST